MEQITQKVVNEYATRFDKEYGYSDILVNEIIARYPSNRDYQSVILKSMMINKFYSTRISQKELAPLAEQIIKIEDLEKMIIQGDLRAVKVISNTDFGMRLSFASKYCSFHNPSRFPIYDKNVRLFLSELYKKCNYVDYKVTQSSLEGNYDFFVKTLDSFISYYDLSKNYKTIDKFMWLYAKEHIEKTKK